MGNSNGKPELMEEDVQALMKSSGRTEEQVRDSFNRFLKDHPEGKIDQAGFQFLMGEALPEKDAKYKVILKIVKCLNRAFKGDEQSYV